jgi:Transglutaminase-like superfamily
VRRFLDLGAWRAAIWARRAAASARRQLAKGRRVDGLVVPQPPALPASAERGVHAALRRLPHTCLERAFVLQTWRAAQGDAREVVIGVSSPKQGFLAHAWLDGEGGSLAEPFTEIMRVGPKSVPLR